jgi:hypothetical protein
VDSTPTSDGRDPAEVVAEQRAHLARHDEVYMRISTWGEDIERAARESDRFARQACRDSVPLPDYKLKRGRARR